MTKRPNLAKKVLPTAIALGLLAPTGFSPAALGQDAQGLEEIVVTGSRGRPRTVADSPVPVDVFSAEDLQDVSYTDTNDILRTLVPSFNLQGLALLSKLQLWSYCVPDGHGKFFGEFVFLPS